MATHGALMAKLKATGTAVGRLNVNRRHESENSERAFWEKKNKRPVDTTEGPPVPDLGPFANVHGNGHNASYFAPQPGSQQNDPYFQQGNTQGYNPNVQSVPSNQNNGLYSPPSQGTPQLNGFNDQHNSPYSQGQNVAYNSTNFNQPRPSSSPQQQNQYSPQPYSPQQQPQPGYSPTGQPNQQWNQQYPGSQTPESQYPPQEAFSQDFSSPESQNPRERGSSYGSASSGVIDYYNDSYSQQYPPGQHHAPVRAGTWAVPITNDEHFENLIPGYKKRSQTANGDGEGWSR